MAIKTAAEIWRDYQTDGVPASGANAPNKFDLRAWGSVMETVGNGGGPGLGYATQAAMNADLSHGANTLAEVYNDVTAANNGLYVKFGASGLGFWSRVGDLPTSIVQLTVTGGTGNAIVATAPETPTGPGVKMFVMTPGANNSGASVLNYNGQGFLPIRSAFGNPLVGGEFLAGSIVLMLGYFDHFTLLMSTNVDASGILTAAVAAEAAAAASATAAAVSAASTAGLLIPIGGRLTLLSGVEIATADIAGATTIYFTPTGSAALSIYNGSAWQSSSFAELSLVLDANPAHTNFHASGNIYDLFAVVDPAGPTTRLVTGPPWPSGTSRGTGAGTTELARFGGRFVNANTLATARYGSASSQTLAVPALQALYVGSFVASANGQATDAEAKRWLYNAYNVANRRLYKQISMPSWTTTSSVLRPMNGDATNSVSVLIAMNGNSIQLEMNTLAQAAAAGVQGEFGISDANNISLSLNRLFHTTGPNYYVPLSYSRTEEPGLGLLTYFMLEASMDNVTALTFNGSNSFTWMTGVYLN